ncbi:Protein M3, variant 2 [Entomophthora muscae]|nr:Protein M3, variant 2 [Entomophthora muscae]
MLSQLLVLVFSPCLLFSKMLDSVTPQAVERMAIVVPIVLFYITLGMVAGFAFRKLFASTLAPDFNYSILVAAGWSNWGDIPLAVIRNITSTPYFKEEDNALGVAYIAVFVMVFNITLFPMGGERLVARDHKSPKVLSNHDIEPGTVAQPTDGSKSNTPQRKSLKARILKFIVSLLTPINIGIIGGLIIGLTPAKDLFISNPSGTLLVAQVSPPLNVIYKSTDFLGAACVPLGLINLGASLVDIDFKRIFSLANFVFACFKLIITPAIGISVIYWMTHGLGIISPDEKVLQLVLMFATCVPSATTSLILYQFYSPSGESHHMASLLVLQYILGSVTMAVTLIVSLILILD